MTRGRALRLLVPLLIVALSPAAARAEEQGRPQALREVGIDQRLNEQIPLDATFRDEAGREVRLGQYVGEKPTILVMAYYQCPMLCTLVLNGLVGTLRTLSFDVGKEFNVLTVSFNPSETPELAAQKKENYLREYGRPGAGEGWHFLTGEPASIARLAQALGYRYKYIPEEKQFAHAAAIMVLTPEGRIARYFYGVEFPPRDLRLGLVEASQGKIGSPVDALMLFCYQYDPETGKYGAMVMNLVRLGGIATMAALAAFAYRSWRRERAHAVRSA